MNSNELRCVLSRDVKIKSKFVDVFALDEFIEYVKRNKNIGDDSVFIVNSETSEKSGEHWLLVYVYYDSVVFIDSFGKHLTFYNLENTLYRIKNKLEFLNEIQLQSSYSNLCGEYCTFFAFNLCREKSLTNILNFFTSDFSRNDASVKKFMNKTFPGHRRKNYSVFSNIFINILEKKQMYNK